LMTTYAPAPTTDAETANETRASVLITFCMIREG
jgi:hypothetical protein